MVNCVGILQDGRQGDTGTIHHDFVNRLIGVQSHLPNCRLLVHVSIPGQESDDATAFSRTKREAEKILSDNPNPYVVLRPGFVIADAAFGGSALVRALAASPFGVPAAAENRPFAITDVEDIAATVSVLCNQWREGTRDWSAMWDEMARETTSFGQVVDAFRERLGVPTPRLRSPPWMLRLGALRGDAAAALGWAPPIRSTSLKEMQRGVEGAPEGWIAATGVTPSSLSEALGKRPASIQEKWFSRLYLLKGLIAPFLAVFWALSGLIVLTMAYDAATAILTTHGFSMLLAHAVTVSSSFMDIAVGLLIATRKTCRFGLIAGIVVSVFYMGMAAILTPEMWIEPLGALVKTGPAIVLMIVALAMQEDR